MLGLSRLKVLRIIEAKPRWGYELSDGHMSMVYLNEDECFEFDETIQFAKSDGLYYTHNNKLELVNTGSIENGLRKFSNKTLDAMYKSYARKPEAFILGHAERTIKIIIEENLCRNQDILVKMLDRAGGADEFGSIIHEMEIPTEKILRFTASLATLHIVVPHQISEYLMLEANANIEQPGMG